MDVDPTEPIGGVATESQTTRLLRSRRAPASGGHSAPAPPALRLLLQLLRLLAHELSHCIELCAHAAAVRRGLLALGGLCVLTLLLLLLWLLRLLRLRLRL